MGEVDGGMIREYERRGWEQKLMLIGVATLLTLPLLMMIFNQNVWTDEIFTIRMAQNNFWEIWGATGQDTHPPLFYWMLKTFTLMAGDAISAYKLFSVFG